MQDRSTPDRSQPDRSPQAQPPSQPPRRNRSIPIGVLAGLSAVGLIAGGSVAWWTWNAGKPALTQSSALTSQLPASPPVSPSVSPAIEKTVQVYWLKDKTTATEKQLQLTAAPASISAEQPKDLLKAAVEKLLKPPADPTLASAIPSTTQLNSLEIQSDGIHIDLSKDFTTGGGSTAMTGRLGQIIYTATTLDPTAPVWIAIDGKPLETLGGEGLVIDQPMTRASFDQNFKF
jgi:spore germination protein GerM